MEEQQGLKKTNNEKATDYGTAGAIAEEVLSAIHTVTSYGGQADIIHRYKCKVASYYSMVVLYFSKDHGDL